MMECLRGRERKWEDEMEGERGVSGLRQVENSLRCWKIRSWESSAGPPGGKMKKGRVSNGPEEEQRGEKML